MKIFGHPVHVMLIHFPSALLPMDLVCSAYASYSDAGEFIHAAFFSLSGGVVFGWMAIVTGIFDLLKIPATNSTAFKKAIYHACINSTAILAYTIVALMGFRSYPELRTDSIGLIGLKLTLVTFLIIGNFLGASLILKHKIGVESE